MNSGIDKEKNIRRLEQWANNSGGDWDNPISSENTWASRPVPAHQWKCWNRLKLVTSSPCGLAFNHIILFINIFSRFQKKN